jgi:hypothetical protein
MLALDPPVSLETNLKALKSNGRTEEMLKLLGGSERLRLANAVQPAVREKLRVGEWYLARASAGVFHPVRYETQLSSVPGEVRITNDFGAQPLKFRLQAVPALAPVGDKKNIVLLRSNEPLEVKQPDPKAPMPGALAGRIEFTKPVGEQASVFMVGPETRISGGTEGKPLDLSSHRALAVKISVEGHDTKANEPPAVLNVQIESGGKTYRDHYINLNANCEQTVIIPAPTTERMLSEFRPNGANYAFKLAMYHFNYQSIVALNLRWMRAPKAETIRCRLLSVEALAESDSTLKNPRLSIGAARLTVPYELKTGDYAEFWADGSIRVFDRNGMLLTNTKPIGNTPIVQLGECKILLQSEGRGAAKFTAIILGEALKL